MMSGKNLVATIPGRILNNNALYIVCFLFYLFFIAISLLSGQIEYIFTQALYGIILWLFTKVIFDKNDLVAKRYVLLGYVYLSVIAMLLIWHHNNAYQWDFDRWGDDHFYFTQAQYYKSHLFEKSYSIYEKILAVILNIFNYFGINDDPSLVLPLNWMIASLTIGLSYKLALIVSNIVKLPFWLFFLSIFLNYTFVQNSVHLYRDIFIAFFSILAILSIINKSWIKSIIYSVLVAPFRFPNAIFNLSLIGIKLFIDRKKKNFLILGIFLLIFGAFASFAIKNSLKISKYDMGNISQEIEKRNNTYSGGDSSQNGGGLAMLYKLPEPLRFIINIPVQVVRPITIKNPFKTEFDHRQLGYAITTITLIILIGYYFRGIIIGIFSRDKNIKFLIYTLIIYAFVIGYLSFLDRNRIIMIPLFPTLIAVNFMNYSLSNRGKKILYFFSKKSLSLLMLLIILILS